MTDSHYIAQIGDIVRSHDFVNRRSTSGENACFVVGIVKAIHPAGYRPHQDHPGFTCETLEIAAEFEVWRGEQSDVDKTVYPPQNGVLTTFERVTDGVELVSPRPAAACGQCGGWSPYGGMSHYANSTERVLGRPGCTCN